MQLGDHLGVASILLALIGIGVTISFPTKKPIAYTCFGLAAIVLVGWGFATFHSNKEDHAAATQPATKPSGPAAPSSSAPPSEKPEKHPFVPVQPRSYLRFDTLPMFAGSSPNGAEGSAYSVGDPLGFNIHFEATGPNPVRTKYQYLDTEVVSNAIYANGNYDTGVINQAVLAFLARKKIELKRHKSDDHLDTMMQGDRQFNTAFSYTDGYTKHRIVSQKDLDAVGNGSETWVVLSEIAYLDGNTTHHLRKCMFLMPPGKPSSIWHSCGGDFPDSD